MSLLDELNELSFNLVIDFPARDMPRLRVFLLEIDGDDNIVMPVEIIEFPTAEACKEASRFIQLNGHFPTLPVGTEQEIVSIMIPGITEMASYIYGWSSEYQRLLGKPLFPTPKLFAHRFTSQLVTTLAQNSGMPLLESAQIVINFVDNDEEDYRPGIYL